MIFRPFARLTGGPGLLSLIALVTCDLLGVPVSCCAQNWVGILDPSRAIDWSHAGVQGGIPERTTIYTTLSPGVSADAISAALAKCPSGQVVYLSAGTYNLSAGITFANHSNVTLRGAGPDQTFLVFTGYDACGGKSAAIGVINGYPIDRGGPANFADWTAGYARGTTSITLSNLTGNRIPPTVGTMIVLDQLSDDTADTGEVYVCSTSPTCTQAGPRGQSRLQQQIVTVTSVTGSGPWTVGINPGLYMPNWRSEKKPQAWWPGNQTRPVNNTLPVTGVGIESMSIDASNSRSVYGISFVWAANSWVKNVRLVRARPEPVGHSAEKHVLFFLSAHNTVRDSYFFGRLGDDAYGVDGYWCSDNLVENNIFQHIPNPMMNEKGQGNVWAYNYATNNLWGHDGTWAQGSNYYHAPGSSYELHEGNDGHGLEMENYFGQVHFITAFRNRFTGYDPPQISQTVPILVYALNRYENLIGNALGTAGYHTKYQTVATGPASASNSNRDCVRSIYAIGLGGNCSSGDGVTWPFNDPTLTLATLMRWGNWDVVTNEAKFDPSEVPQGLSRYGNFVPPTQKLPASFYLPSKPDWWGTMPWPAIGPDVSNGDVPMTGGHAYRIPARELFEDAMRGSFGDTVPRHFRGWESQK